MKVALLLIDLQNDYFPGGKKVLNGATEAASRAATALALFRKQKLPVFHVQHIANYPGATFFLPNTPGADIHELLTPRPEEAVVEKHFPNSFRQTTLLSLLQTEEITHLVICGMMTHMCVEATTRAAADLGYTVTLIDDACATREQEFDGRAVAAADVHAAFLAGLRDGGYATPIKASALAAHLDKLSSTS